MSDPKITISVEDIPKIAEVLKRSVEHARIIMEREIATAKKKYNLTLNACNSEQQKLRSICTHPNPKHSFLEVGPHEYKDYWVCVYCEEMSFDRDRWDV